MEMMQKCPRCMGRGKMFRKGSGWSMIDSGGAEATCPCCNGERFIKDVRDKTVEEVKEMMEPEKQDKHKTKPLPKKKAAMGKPKQAARPEGVAS